MHKSLFQGYQMSVIEQDGLSYARLNPSGVIYVLLKAGNKFQVFSRRLQKNEKPIDVAAEMVESDVAALGETTLPEFLNTQAHLFVAEAKEAGKDWLTVKDINEPILALLALKAGLLK